MKAAAFWHRAVAKGRRTLATHLDRRDLKLRLTRPIVSFSFDDAPRTAFSEGGSILEAHGARATYYMSLGLLGRDTEVGTIADLAMLERALEAGHELGCHTFDHVDAWHVDAQSYLASVDVNRLALERALPGQAFSTFAYPKSGARACVKAGLSQRFDCCRGGGQTFNAGRADLNLLSACFIDQRAGMAPDTVCSLVERNAQECGWLIFATHDICAEPSRYGTSSRAFESVVRCAAQSGAALLPVGEACRRVRAGD